MSGMKWSGPRPGHALTSLFRNQCDALRGRPKCVNVGGMLERLHSPLERGWGGHVPCSRLCRGGYTSHVSSCYLRGLWYLLHLPSTQLLPTSYYAYRRNCNMHPVDTDKGGGQCTAYIASVR